MTSEPEITESAGNPFADLGVAEPEEMQLKAELTRRIASIIEHRHLKQAEAAEILGIDQPKVSALLRGRIRGFSIERLIRFCLLLGRDVEITIKPKPRSRARARVAVRS